MIHINECGDKCVLGKRCIVFARLLMKYGKRIADKFQECALSAYAGQAAFFMMLSFFPFLLFFFSLLNLTPLTEKDFMVWMSTMLPETFHDYVAGFTREIYKGSTGRISITVISAIFLSSKAFLALQQGVNAVYGVKEQRNYVLLRILGMFYSIVLAVVMIFLLGIVVFGKWFHAHFFVQIPIVGELIGRILDFRVSIAILVLFVFMWMMYCFLPNQKQRWKEQVVGAVLASAGWILFSYGFSVYVERFNNYASFYGAMTTIALVMVWLYGCMYMFFLGGLLNHFLCMELGG